MLGELLLAVAASADLACPAPGVAPTLIDASLQNLASVASGPRRGYGLVVGWRPGEAWIAVPAHVVYETGEVLPPDEALRAGLTVRFDGDPDPRQLCEVTSRATNPTPRQDASIDLAFVCVRWQAGPLFLSGLAARTVRIGDELQLVGPGGVGEGRKGRVLAIGEGMQDGGDVRAERLVGEEGLSGLPAVSPAGVVGLYLGKGNGGRVLSMSAMREKAEAAKVPWRLGHNEFYDCTRQRRVCPVVADDGLVPARIKLANAFNAISADAPIGTCSDIPEGKYLLSVPGRDTVCEPRTIVVLSGSEPLSISVVCAPRLGGKWRVAGSKESMTCSESAAGMAQCSGLGGLGMGILTANLSARGAQVSLGGSFYTAGASQRPARGELTWTPGQLKGWIEREGYPSKQVELTRSEEEP